MKNFKVYQISEEVKNSRYLMFSGFDMLKSLGLEFDFNNYKEVYDGNIIESSPDIYKVLDEIFHLLNIGKRPENYNGHSLSVSDVVYIDGRYFFCDSYGWEEVMKKNVEVKAEEPVIDIVKVADKVEKKIKNATEFYGQYCEDSVVKVRRADSDNYVTFDIMQPNQYTITMTVLDALMKIAKPVVKKYGDDKIFYGLDAIATIDKSGNTKHVPAFFITIHK